MKQGIHFYSTTCTVLEKNVLLSLLQLKKKIVIQYVFLKRLCLKIHVSTATSMSALNDESYNH